MCLYLHADGVQKQPNDVLITGICGKVKGSHTGLAAQFTDKRIACRGIRLDRCRNMG